MGRESYKIDNVTDPSSKESPITTKDVTSVVEKYLTEQDQLSELSSKMVNEFSKRSSKHKFIVQVTKVKGDTKDANLVIGADFGAAWESEKDGYITVSLANLNNDDTKPTVSIDKDTNEDPSDVLDDYVEIENNSHQERDQENLFISIFWLYVG